MKRHFKLALLVLIVCMITAMVFIACDDNLPSLKTPSNVHFDGDTLIWDSVKNAETYEIDIFRKGETSRLKTQTVSEPTYTIYLDEKGEYELAIRAVGDLESYGYSEYTSKISYTRGDNIAKPITTLDGTRLSWIAVSGAGAYHVMVTNSENETVYSDYTTNTFFNFEGEDYTDPDAYSIRVKSVVASGINNQLDSAYSDIKTYYKSEKLADVSFSSPNSTRIYWNYVSNASSYLITATKKDDTSVVLTYEYTGTSSSPSMLYTSLGITEVGEYDLTVQAIGDGLIYLDSNVSTVDARYKIVKLANYDPAGRWEYTVAPDYKTAVLKWKVTEEEMKTYNSMVLKFTAINSTSVTVNDEAFQIYKDTSSGDIITEQQDGTTQDIRYTKEDTDYVFEYDLNKKFYTYGDDGIVLNEDGSSAVIDQNKMGYYYTISIQARNATNGYLSTDATEVSGIEYLTATRPQYDAEQTIYTITKASDMFYMSLEPNAKYQINPTSKILDMSGMYWKPIDSFTGMLNGQDTLITNLTLLSNDNGDSALFNTIENDARVDNLYMMGLKFDYATEENNTLGIYNKRMASVAIENNGVISGGYIDGTLASTSADVAGVVYTNKGVVSDFVLDMNISGRMIAAGIAINNSAGANITNCSNRKSVTTTGELITNDNFSSQFNNDKAIAAGLVAENSGNVTYSYAVGNVSAKASAISQQSSPEIYVLAGGLIGYNHSGANVLNSYAGPYFTRNNITGSVRADNSRGIAGGFVAINEGQIANAYTTLRAYASKSVGGFVGENKYIGEGIKSCYATGGALLVGAENSGSFVGDNTASALIVNSFYYDSSSDHKDDVVSYVTVEKLTEEETLIALNSSDFVIAKIDQSNVFNNIVLKGINADAYTIELSYGADFSTRVNAYYCDADGVVEITSANEDESTSGWIGGEYTNAENTLRRIVYNGSIFLLKVDLV